MEVKEGVERNRQEEDREGKRRGMEGEEEKEGTLA